MTMTSARDRIADIALDIARVAVANYRNLGYEYMSREDAEDFEHEVNDIIATVREVLLSEEAMSAFHDAEGMYEYSLWDGWLQAYQSGMSSALEAAFLGDPAE